MTRQIVTLSRPSGNDIRKQLEEKTGKNRKKYLSFLTAQKMIKRFLAYDRIMTIEVRCRKFTIQELAKKLSVDPVELDLFIKPVSKLSHRRILGEIAFPLIELYCNTKWADVEW